MLLWNCVPHSDQLSYRCCSCLGVNLQCCCVFPICSALMLSAEVYLFVFEMFLALLLVLFSFGVFFAVWVRKGGRENCLQFRMVGGLALFHRECGLSASAFLRLHTGAVMLHLLACLSHGAKAGRLPHANEMWFTGCELVFVKEHIIKTSLPLTHTQLHHAVTVAGWVLYHVAEMMKCRRDIMDELIHICLSTEHGDLCPLHCPCAYESLCKIWCWVL